MVKGRRAHWSFALVATLAAVTFGPSPASGAASLYPAFDAVADNHSLGQANDLGFDVFDLDASGATGKIVLATPDGYSASVVKAAQATIGTAELGVVSTTGGSITTYKGSLVAMDAASYAADTGAQACAPGSHTALWRLNLASVPLGDLSIPVAVDASGGGYKLTMCFSAVQASGKQVSDVYVSTADVFRNPVKHGSYLFDGTVTPFASDGTLNAASAYELRAYELMPQVLTAQPSYNTAAKTLTITGNLSADNQPRGATNVHVYGGTSANADKWTDLGFVVTATDGSYTFSKSLPTLRYPYVYVHVNHYTYQTCKGATTAPGGCASYSIDGRSSYSTKVLVNSSVLTDRKASARLRSVLLGPAALDQVPGAPASGFILTPTNATGLSSNPDPRAPCGAKIAAPSLQSGALEIFVSTTKILLTEWANQLGPGAAAAFIQKQVGNTHRGCAAFDSSEAGGGKQHNKLVDVISLPTIADPSSAVVIQVSDASGKGYITEIAIQRGAVLRLTQLVSAHRVSDSYVKNLAIAVAKQLDRLKA